MQPAQKQRNSDDTVALPWTALLDEVERVQGSTNVTSGASQQEIDKKLLIRIDPRFKRRRYGDAAQRAAPDSDVVGSAIRMLCPDTLRVWYSSDVNWNRQQKTSVFRHESQLNRSGLSEESVYTRRRQGWTIQNLTQHNGLICWLSDRVQQSLSARLIHYYTASKEWR